MANIFSPGIALMSRLKYPQKFAVISLLFGFLIAGLMYLLLSEINRDIEFTKREIIGIEYVKALLNLMEDVQERRGLSMLYLSGDKTYKESYSNKKSQINNDFEVINEVNLKYNDIFRISTNLNRVKSKWQNLASKTNSLTPDESYTAHTAIVSEIATLISYVGDKANLVLDPQISSFYLIDSIVSLIPSLTEQLGLARSISSSIAFKKRITNQEKSELIGIIARIRSILTNLDSNADKVTRLDNNPNVDIQTRYTMTNNAVSSFVNLIETEIIHKDNITISQSRVFSSGSSAIDTAMQLSNYETRLLNRLLQDRINDLKARRLLIVLSSLLILLLITYLFAAFYISTVGTITALKDASKQVAEGNMDVEVKPGSRDEIGSLAESLNTMTGNLRNLVSREQFLRQITLSSISSLDIKDIIQTIVMQTGQLFMADRCFFMPYNAKTKSYEPIEDYESYISSLEISDVIGFKVSEEMMEPFTKFAFGQKRTIIITNAEKLSLSKTSKELLQRLNIKSAAAAPVIYGNTPLGLLIVNYVVCHRNFSANDIDLLETIANQAAILMHQATLYGQIQDKSSRESILRTIINKVLVSENFDEAILSISTEVGKIFDADRTTLRFFDIENRSFSEVVGEYRKTENVPSAYGQGGYPAELNEYFAYELFDKKETLVIDNINDPMQPEILRDIFSSLGVKSTIVVPVFFKREPIAAIFITNTESYKTWQRRDIDLLAPISQQVSIGIHLFRLNDKLSKSLDNEKMLREMLVEIRRLENHDKIFNYLLSSLNTIFNTQRSLHLHYAENGNLLVENEAITNNDLEPLINQKIFCSRCNPDEFSPSGPNRIIVKNDVKDEIQDDTLRNYLLSNGIRAYLLYSTSRRIITESEEEVIGLTMMCSNLPRRWTQDEIDLFKLIIDTISVAYLEIRQREELDKTRRTFIATLTHDLRSPINAEQKALEFILSRKPESQLGDFTEYLGDIYKTNEELLRIVNNMLSIYHYESERWELNLDAYDIKDIVINSVRPLKYLAKEQNSEIIVDIPDNLPQVKVDNGEIARVITNLVSNAIKHTRKNTVITVKAEKADNVVKVSVADNGQGIPEAERDKIFQRYPTTKRVVGTGLGLFLSKQIVEAHNGDMWFDSEEGKGTTFYFTLPIA